MCIFRNCRGWLTADRLNSIPAIGALHIVVTGDWLRDEWTDAEGFDYFPKRFDVVGKKLYLLARPFFYVRRFINLRYCFRIGSINYHRLYTGLCKPHHHTFFFFTVRSDHHFICNRFYRQHHVFTGVEHIRSDIIWILQFFIMCFTHNFCPFLFLRLSDGVVTASESSQPRLILPHIA
ncbi:MAG TPA: hypothetical protein DEP23_13160 [Ruminococcaceae bacterium]|nr:hypothetical protein [Oscillospiraceae bacterium]